MLEVGKGLALGHVAPGALFEEVAHELGDRADVQFGAADVAQDVEALVVMPRDVVGAPGEVVSDDIEGMLREGRHFAKLAPNIIVKVPMSEVGLEAIARLAEEGIKTNCTLIFSANQGLLAAKAGASLLSPFVGRLDDINEDGMEVVRDLVAIVDTYHLDTEVLAASIRTVNHVKEAALIGADVVTAPAGVLHKLAEHPLTDKGLTAFLKDWSATGQKIV